MSHQVFGHGEPKFFVNFIRTNSSDSLMIATSCHCFISALKNLLSCGPTIDHFCIALFSCAVEELPCSCYGTTILEAAIVPRHQPSTDSDCRIEEAPIPFVSRCSSDGSEGIVLSVERLAQHNAMLTGQPCG